MRLKFLSKLIHKKEPKGYGKKYVIETIDKFISNKPMGPYDWDDFISIPIKDPYEAWIQRIIIYIEWYFAARGGISEWCHPLGFKALARLLQSIESDTFPYPPTEEEKHELDHEYKIPQRYRKIFFGDCDPGVS